ncbi:MAG: hypothetical protein WC671_02210 [Candidatus Paceibacterota bacterium]|jgi:type II secretory pathway pseudopilin PulG
MNYKLKIKKSRNGGRKVLSEAKGYTIIETMVAVSLFVIIVTIGMGSLLNANLLHRKSQNMRSIIDNLSFVMEDMSKNLRTGYNYHCIISGDILPVSSMSDAKSCASGGWGIAFEPAGGNSLDDNDQWVYYINSGRIFKSTVGPSSLPNFIQLTPDEIKINSVSSFTVEGAEPPEYDVNGNLISSDDAQPFVTIKLVGEIDSNGVVSPFSLQTSVSQRNLDI